MNSSELTDSRGPERLRLIEVAFDPKQSGGVGPYTYLNPGRAEVGDLVLAGLAGRSLLGIVMDASEKTRDELEFDAAKLRAASPPIRGLALPPHAFRVAALVAGETLCTFETALAAFMPTGIRNRLVTHYELEPGFDPAVLLTATQAEAVAVLQERGGLDVTSATKLSAAMQRTFRNLERKGVVRQTLRLNEAGGTSEIAALRLTQSEDKIATFLAREAVKKPAQAVVVLKLQEAPGASFTAEQIRIMCAVSDATLKQLVKAGLLEQDRPNSAVSASAPPLNPDQSKVVESLLAAMSAGSFSEHLLFGVTGSGKTEVYLRLAAQALAQGKQVLYLVPEIALTVHVIGQLRARFGNLVALLHSNMSPAERLQTWIQIGQGQAPIILGPRSALFAPYKNLGLVVMDEEHETSYKQESSPRYHARNVARWVAESYQCPLVLGSATPSVETYFDATEGRIGLHRLPKRAVAATMPRVHIEDLRVGYATGTPSLLTGLLHQKVKERLKRGEQTVLFLNRRAYSPFLGCRECGEVFTCPNCSVTLAWHKRQQQLRCHYCDHRQAVPTVCPTCGGSKVRSVGFGTEKVEEAIRAMFPEARVARLDRDIAAKKGALEAILAQMHAKELDILVGTQMVAKGLDFPNVTLVGVIAADTSLFLPDFRAAERTFQLLSQVSGRSGRGKVAGEVVIQSFSPEHPAIIYAADHDYESMFTSLIYERKSAKYPPFNQLVNVVLQGENLDEVAKEGKSLAKRLRADFPDYTVLGPADCPLERLHGKWRHQILIKMPRGAAATGLREVLNERGMPTVQRIVDVHPQSML